MDFDIKFLIYTIKKHLIGIPFVAIQAQNTNYTFISTFGRLIYMRWSG